jgi:hypothetical protein
MKKNPIDWEKRKLPRRLLVQLYEILLESGETNSPDIEGEFIQKMFQSFGFDIDPKDGWHFVAYELRLLQIATPFNDLEEEIGRAALAKRCAKLSDDAQKVLLEFAELTKHIEFCTQISTVAQDEANKLPPDFFSSFIVFTNNLDRCVERLNDMPQAPKWRRTEWRIRRVELARNLAKLFESQFGLVAKPVGGSASLPLEETNLWTRFYQAVAWAFWNEHVTPDRQAILWEAALPPN